MSKFQFEQIEGQNDRAYVEVDDKYQVVLIRAEEGLIVDVWPKDWDAPFDSLTVYDSDIAEAMEEDENTA